MTTTGWRRIGWGVLLFMSLVGLMVTTGHYAFQPSVEQALAGGYGPSPTWFLEQMPRYREHAVVTFLHVVPGFLFMLLAPVQLVARIRARYPAVHRAVGRTFIGLALIIVASSVALGIIMPFDGRLETVGTLFIAGGFLGSMGLGVHAIRRGQVGRHRVWMSRMLAFGYAPITMRFVLSLATEGAGLDGQAIFAETLLIGTAINLLVVRWWLRRHPRPVIADATARDTGPRPTPASGPVTD